MLAMEAAAGAAAWDMEGYLDRGVRYSSRGGPTMRPAESGTAPSTIVPALIVRPWTSGDVQAAVRAAREHQLPLSVLGGGHDWDGRVMRPGGLAIDLSQMRRVTVDARARVATVAGGATAADVVDAAAGHGLTAVVGMTGRLGMAGLTLAGGYGPLTGRFGLALDNLLGADVVLEDGRGVQVDATREPELYWALRGGGGNFGVVTSLLIRLHPLEQVLAGLILFPWGEAVDLWRQGSTACWRAPPGAQRAERSPGRGRRRSSAVPVPGLERRPGAGREADDGPATAGQPGGLPDHPHGAGRHAGPGQLPLGERTPLRGPHAQRGQPHAGRHARARARGRRE